MDPQIQWYSDWLIENIASCRKVILFRSSFCHLWSTGSDPLVRQLYEFDAKIEDFTQGVKPMSEALWKYRRQITVEHLGNSFQQQILSGGEQQCQALNAFLKQVPPTLRHYPFARMCLFCLQEEMYLKVHCTFAVVFLSKRNARLIYQVETTSSQVILAPARFAFKWGKIDSRSCRVSVNTVCSLTITGTQVAFRPVSSWPCSSSASVDGQIS